MSFAPAGPVADEILRLARVREWCPAHKERDFQDLLEATMRQRYCCRVYREVYCEAPGRNRKRRIDMLVVPPKEWAHVETVPVLGIETKMNHGLGTHKEEFFGKLEDYIAADRWWLSSGVPGGSKLPKPTIVLYATPHSVALEHAVYDWRDETVRKRVARQARRLAPPGSDAAIEAAIDLTQLEVFSLDFDRDLWKRGAAILHGPWDRDLWFQTNRFAAGTPKYSFSERAKKVT